MVRLFGALASHGPLVAVIEDLHWASPGLLATLEHIATRVSDAPLLLICTARPELLEARPDWPRRAQSAQTIPLESLGEEDCAVLVAELLGGGQAARALAGPVGSVAGGNPLVVEEVLAMLIDDDLIAREDDGWRLKRTVEEIRIPPTIEAILAARLDRLSEGERDLIERAAVVGKEFNVTDIEALGNEDPETLNRIISRAHRQAADRGRGGCAERLPLPPHARTRRRVCGDAQAPTSRSARALRGLHRELSRGGVEAAPMARLPASTWSGRACFVANLGQGIAR